MLYTIVSAPKAGRCPLCTGKADQPQPVFNVTGAGYAGMACGTHLHTLCQQVPEGNGRAHEATLFGDDKS